jgi:hypothetical protein
MSLTFNEAQIKAGIELVKAWYESMPVCNIEPKEFIEAIRVAAQDQKPESDGQTVGWSGVCC